MLQSHSLVPTLAANQTQLRVLATTDLHMWMLGYDYYLDRPEDRQSLARLAPLIAARRGEALNSVLFDNGDLLQGTPMADVLAADWDQGVNEPHPVMRALTCLGYDAATLGNHDFNYGLPYLDYAIKSAGFPVVCANAIRARGATPQHDTPFLPPWCLIERALVMADGSSHPIKIGVLGLLPPQIVDWDEAHLAGALETRGIAETARYHVPKMKEAGADIIIALCHSGFGEDSRENHAENAGLALSEIPGIDAIVLGHEHRLFPSDTAPSHPNIDAQLATLSGVPTVMPGFWGSHLGVIDLTLTRQPAGWSVAAHSARAEDPTGYQPTVINRAEDRLVTEPMQRAHARTLELVRQPVGTSTTRLQSYFAMLGASPVLNLIAGAKAHHTKALVAAGELPDLPILCLTTPFKSGGRGGPSYFTDIPEGPLAARHVADMYLYPNTLEILQCTGGDVVEILRGAANCFSVIAPGAQDAPLLVPEIPHYKLDWLQGLTYAYDLSATDPEARVHDIRLHGRPLRDDELVLLASNNYRLSTGAPKNSAEEKLLKTRIPMTKILANYLQSAPSQSPTTDSPMRMTPYATETTAVFETGPTALPLVDAHPKLEALGIDANGFLTVRLTL